MTGTYKVGEAGKNNSLPARCPEGRTCEGEAMRGGEKGKSVLLVLRGGAVQASTFLLSCSDVALSESLPKGLGSYT